MIYQYFKTICYAFVITFFSACSSSVLPSQTAIPQWFLNTPNNTSNSLYGSAEAVSLQEAKNRALNDMASRLIVQINSSIEQNTYTSSNSYAQNQYSNTTQQRIQVLVKAIDFSNAKVVQSAFINQRYYVLMQVNRVELFRQQKEKFDRVFNYIQQQNKEATTRPKLDKIYQLQRLLPQLQDASEQAKILNAINNGFDDNHYLSILTKISDQYRVTKESLKVRLSDNLSQTFFAQKVIESLNTKAYNVVSGNEDVKIALDSSVNYSVALGWHIAKVTTSLNVIANGKVVSTHIINSIGRSTSTKQNALIGASREFGEKLNEKGIEAILFNQDTSEN